MPRLLASIVAVVIRRIKHAKTAAGRCQSLQEFYQKQTCCRGPFFASNLPTLAVSCPARGRVAGADVLRGGLARQEVGHGWIGPLERRTGHLLRSERAAMLFLPLRERLSPGKT